MHNTQKTWFSYTDRGCFLYTGWPKKNRNSRLFRTLRWSSYLFSPCWIEHLFLIIITPRSSNLVEFFFSWVISYGLSFSGFAINLSLLVLFTEQSIFQDFALLNSYLFFTLVDRASFFHYNNTKIIKFGWELFILWLISYELSFSGFDKFFINRASELWKSGKSRKWQSIRNY